jgi:hypothetical protein
METESVLLGVGFSMANALVAVICYAFSFKLNNNRAMELIFGSLTFRIISVALGFYFLFKYSDINQQEFSIAFSISTFIFIFAEVFLVNYRLNSLNLKKNK